MMKTSGFEGIAQPAAAPPDKRLVTLQEVACYALAGHYVCRGKGIVRKAGKPVRACQCAQKRFMKANGAKVDVDQKTLQVSWR